MKQLLIFLLLFFSAASIDLKPLNLEREKKQSITVTLRGAVNNPGEIALSPYATIHDALKMADLKDTADVEPLNQATVLNDHDVLSIPEKRSDQKMRISINTADVEQLCTLPGIGEGTAQRIIAYRQETGLFQKTEDLLQVKGIGPSKYEKLREFITL